MPFFSLSVDENVWLWEDCLNLNFLLCGLFVFIILSLLLLCMYVCSVCVSVCIHIGTCTGTQVCGGWRLMFAVFLDCCLPYIVKAGGSSY